MSRSKSSLGWSAPQNMMNKARPSTARFCPYCGVADRLSRDTYTGRTNNCDFVCQVCCSGFRLGQSPRLQKALEMFAEHRAMRDNKLEAGVSEAVKERWGSEVSRQGKTTAPAALTDSVSLPLHGGPTKKESK